MKRLGLFIGLSVCLLYSCMNTDDCYCGQLSTTYFNMQEVPYVMEGDSIESYHPYYELITNLTLMAFRQQMLDTVATYDYQYAKEHPEIPFLFQEPGTYNFFWVANLLHPRDISWDLTPEGRVVVWFSIWDKEEPPLYLTAFQKADLYGPLQVDVQLNILVAQLEVRLVNPPFWATQVDFDIQDIARQISVTYALRDTTSLWKSVPLVKNETNTYWTEINSFPSYPGHPAIVNVLLRGENRTQVYSIEDDRLNLQAGKVVRLSLEYKGDEILEVGVEVNGKWEEKDEGQIEI